MNILLALLLISLAVTLFIAIKEPRSLFLGVFFVFTLGFLFVYLIVGMEIKGSSAVGSFLSQVFLILAIILSFIILLFPLGITITLIVNGVKLIKKEGLKLTNLLSLVLGIFLLAFPILSGIYIKTFEANMLLMTIYSIGMMIFSYLVVVIASYTISSFLNFIHIGRRKVDYVVVLGSGLIGDKVTPLLASRINKGIKIYEKNKGSRLIMSGGKGANELVAEGEAMKKYAVEKGVNPEDIIVENKSVNTDENIRFSRSLMEENTKFCIVTNYYHLFRALLIAKNAGIKCIGYGSRTKLYFSINAFIREIIGYLHLKRKLHGTVIAIFSMLTVMSEIIVHIFR